MNETGYKTYLSTEQAMLDFGALCASFSAEALTIFLYGNLGAGKTTLVRGFLRGLGHEGSVKSPTYTIVEPYQLQHLQIFHFDLYRVHDGRELEYIGIQDYFAPNAICLIEWPEQGKGFLPPADLSFYIESFNEGREIKIIAHSERGQRILQRLQNEN